MRTALRITNWIVTIFFVHTVLSTFSDLYFPQKTYRCAMPQMSFLIVIAFPLSLIILTISFFEIKKLEMIVPNLYLLTVTAPDIAPQIRPGQFVIFRSDDDAERIPLSVADWDKNDGTITVVFIF